MKMIPWQPLLVLAVVVIVSIAVITWWPASPAPRPPAVVEKADSVIATRAADTLAIAKARDDDSLHAGRAAAHETKGRTAREVAELLDSAAAGYASQAKAATNRDTAYQRLQAAYEARTSETDSLKAVIVQKDSTIGELKLELLDKETAFQLADRRRRAMEPLLQELRDSVTAHQRPPRRWHLFGVTCGGAGTQQSVGVGCAIGPTYTP